eukprot:4202053-Pyramimonas_sp.AAC.2
MKVLLGRDESRIQAEVNQGDTSLNVVNFKGPVTTTNPRCTLLQCDGDTFWLKDPTRRRSGATRGLGFYPLHFPGV